MKFTLEPSVIQKYLSYLKKQHPRLFAITDEIIKQGGKPLLVGGAVRDLCMNIMSKDIDIEVHNITLDNLEKLLGKFGPVSLVGQSFGVLRVHGLDIDWSVPRKDSKGRKPEIVIDPFMSIEDAFRRRELTINAMGIDLTNGQLLDPFGGLQDIHEKKLRAVDPTLFIEDPLRFFRLMQFIARFEFTPDQELNGICTTMNLQDIARERIEAEFAKMFLRSKRPSLGIRWLKDIGRIKELYPELFALMGTIQDPEFHPEGDVFEHSMQALDAAVPLASKLERDEDKLILMYAALCHDIGKPETTFFHEGRLRSWRHEELGVPIAKRFLKRITENQHLIDAVLVLIRYHMQPGQFIFNHAGPSAYKRLARNLSPETTMHMLILLCYADARARNDKFHDPLTDEIPFIAEFEKKVQELNVENEPEPPVLQGRDLLDKMAPGPEMGNLLKKAYEIQIEEGIKDKEELKKRVLS